MGNRKLTDVNSQISEEAAEWFVDFRVGDIDADARAGFNEWLRRGPDHVHAYLEVAAIWHEGATLDVENRFDTEALIELARADGHVVDLGRHGALAHRFDSARNTLSGWASAAVAAALIAVGVGSWGWWNKDVYRTGIGEQRSVTLEDGSSVQLNSRSAIRVRYSTPKRSVLLLEGQALFDVAKDPNRPFVVDSGGARVRAVGTEFDVYRRTSGTTVTVVEGQVEVRPSVQRGSAPAVAVGSAAFASPLMLTAGEQITVSPDRRAATSRQVDVSVATAWTQRRLIFESASLEEVAEEFNRYNRKQIVLLGDRVVDFHISGVFSSTDPSSLIRFLHERSGIQVVEHGNEIRISRAGVSTR